MELPPDIALLLGRLRDGLLAGGGLDDWVEHGLVVLPRAEAVLTAGGLITKSEAISRLADFGVPASLAGEIRRRRAGEAVMLGAVQRVRRARLARRIMRRGVRRLSRLDPAASRRA